MGRTRSWATFEKGAVVLTCRGAGGDGATDTGHCCAAGSRAGSRAASHWTSAQYVVGGERRAAGALSAGRGSCLHRLVLDCPSWEC